MPNLPLFNKWAPIFINRLRDDFSLSLLSAAAIIGNAGHESGGFKDLQEKKPLVKGSRGGYGIMQWTGPRRREYEDYCDRNNLDPSDMESNYKFLFVELKGPEGRVLLPLEAAVGLEAKVKVFSDKFLRPGIPHMDSRVIWTKRALNAWEAAGNGVSTPSPKIEDQPKPKTFWQILLEFIYALAKNFR